jgi:adenylate cyclase
MTKRWRLRTICALIALGSASASLLLSRVRFFQLLNYKATDAHFVVKGSERVPKIVLITADQKAFDRFPELQMFWHRYYAEAIRAAGEAGAKVIGLDHAFGVPVERWEPGLDGILAGAVAASPIPVICAYVPELNTNRASQAVPLNMVAAGLGLAGYTNLTSDSDDFVRRQELFEGGSTPERSIALRIVEKYLGKDATFENGALILDGRPVPVAADRSLWINFAGPPGTFDRISLADVMDHTNDPAWFKPRLEGKIVLIGIDSFTDRYATPFYTMFSGPRWTTAGVEIHASTVRTLLERNFLRPAPAWLRAAGVVAAAGLTVAVALSVSASAAGVWLVGICAGIFAATHLLFRAGFLTSTSEAILAALFSAIAAVIYRFATEQVRGNLFHKAVSLFVSKDLAKSLDETQTIGLSGKRVTVTILFTDIRGFTAFTEKVCEEQGPEVVVDLLNRYMASMVGIIVKYHGHVNKFIGDGILAVFSDDDEGAEPGDHARRGVKCAAEMIVAPSNFKTGAGLHTGLVVVGNVGSADKMEYTVLGDTVNLASRLESLNKEHKTSLLMSESTYEALEGKVPAVLLASVPVRGKAAEVKLYTVPND